ncbi:unnamed protein product [Prorocentrum cordatum]|uniref:Dolichol kinase n=1 Tax=Prorocentrum cordatum TaxID=2364126 RepID=A0ABN9S523_9DINO|nr:unnamed protein product [Polarella glacialis]
MKHCKEWAVKSDPASDSFLTLFLVVLTLTALTLAAAIKAIRTNHLHTLLKNAGVAGHKVAKTAWEIDRKRFKLTGLGIPMVHQTLRFAGFSNNVCIGLCWAFAISWTLCDLMRIHVPPFRRILDWVFKEILRKDEQYQLSGASWFLLGCALTIHLFSPVIATASIVFLVMGVLCSALITRSFGNSLVTVGAGAEGHKSIEGCATMFVVCFLLGCGIFHQSYLREYPVFIAALVATLAEYYEPLGISYNVSIPVLTAVALTLGFERTISCGAAVVVEGAARAG